MIKSFYASMRWAKWAYGVGLVLLLLILAQVFITVKFNDWYGTFYDLMQNATTSSVSEFYDCLKLFMLLAVPYVWIFSGTNWLTKMYALRWREAMTFSYLPRWSHTTDTVEGASQRIQQDTERFSRIVETLGLAVVRATMTLMAFIPILWGLSEGIDIPILRDVPGSLMWLALIVSIGGMIVSWFVGYWLPGLEYNNQKTEAAYRKRLVHAEDDRSLCDNRTMTQLFTGVRTNCQRLYLHYGYFDLWAITFSQCMVIAPYVLMGKGLFTGAITLGVMIQVANAFSEVRESFSLFISRWRTITELRSIWKRLHEFESKLSKS